MYQVHPSWTLLHICTMLGQPEGNVRLWMRVHNGREVDVSDRSGNGVWWQTSTHAIGDGLEELHTMCIAPLKQSPPNRTRHPRALTTHPRGYVSLLLACTDLKCRRCARSAQHNEFYKHTIVAYLTLRQKARQGACQEAATTPEIRNREDPEATHGTATERSSSCREPQFPMHRPSVNDDHNIKSKSWRLVGVEPTIRRRVANEAE